ncbi:adenylate/guanylate cyclase domain-containing protein [Coleofasciculus sp. FACHB-129]|uniref:adenylate/guanylate cyclase domain-containing protein n=1 Tax=Cyanophyceae TaxID=3028117 RepID=UPI001683F0F7|nr:adenylate/guanylate cyclase domain-containing protein [Coleofasciculus sp. FACHB-129]
MLNFFPRRQSAIAKAAATLEAYGVKPAVRQHLTAFLQESDSRELYHANPRRIAERLHLSEREALRVLVTALKEGILSLNWDIQCPMCRGIDFKPKSLYDLRTNHTCPQCHTVHATDADEQVRITFSIDERLRRLGRDADDPNFRAKVDAQYGVVSGHQMLTLQTFRDFFPRETIPPNESLTIRRVAILFSDLAGSTALYARRGDSRAYHLVRRHFELLFQVVDSHNGVFVKTIGDAVMAAFTAPADATRSAIAMHQQMEALNQQLQLTAEDRLILKIGIDVGPCISVTLNERLDYFGTTVNTAARVQATSQGNDIAFTETVLMDADTASAVKDCPRLGNAMNLKGLDAPILVYRIELMKAICSKASDV